MQNPRNHEHFDSKTLRGRGKRRRKWTFHLFLEQRLAVLGFRDGEARAEIFQDVSGGSHLEFENGGLLPLCGCVLASSKMQCLVRYRVGVVISLMVMVPGKAFLCASLSPRLLSRGLTTPAL